MGTQYPSLAWACPCKCTQKQIERHTQRGRGRRESINQRYFSKYLSIWDLRFIGVTAHPYKSQSCHPEVPNCRTLKYQDETLSTHDEIISQWTHYKLIDLIKWFSWFLSSVSSVSSVLLFSNIVILSNLEMDWKNKPGRKVLKISQIVGFWDNFESRVCQICISTKQLGFSLWLYLASQCCESNTRASNVLGKYSPDNL